jgi:NADH dehydrogenase, FAD-containing subunit
VRTSQWPGHPNIFVIGDAAEVRDKVGQLVPGVAPAAKQMGVYVGRLIAARVAGKSSPVFRYRHLGDSRPSGGGPRW